MEQNGTCATSVVFLRMALLMPLFTLVLLALFHLTEKREKKARSEKAFSGACSFCVLLLCYLPMFVIMYPGIMGYDSPYQMTQALSGKYSTHHPLLHTLMLGFFGRMNAVMGSFSRAMALYTLTQMSLLAFFFSRACVSIARFAGRRAAVMAWAFLRCIRCT